MTRSPHPTGPTPAAPLVRRPVRPPLECRAVSRLQRRRTGTDRHSTARWNLRTPRTLRALATLAVLKTALLLGLPATPWNPVSAQEPERVTSVEGVTEYRLDNGLQVLLFPDPSDPTITVNITYLVGSRHEGYGETGMAHLLEHLLFQGTPDHPDIMQELTEHGARPNGTTWFDRTNYFETFPASSENLEWALDLEADRMVNSFVSAEDLESEMTVVRNEMESGENSPFGILRQRILSTAYLWHNYGQSTIGARSDVENVPIERLQAFYRKYYQPDNAVLIVAGRFDEEEALGLVQEKFGAIPRPQRTGDMRIWPTYTDEPTQDGERSVTLRRVGDEKIVMAMYHVPPGSHPDFAAVEVLGHALGDTPSGRLHRTLVEPGIASRASAAPWQLAEASPFFAWATVREEGDLEAAWEVLSAELERIGGEEPVTAAELERARTDLLNARNNLFDDTERVALALTEWVAIGDWRLFFLHRDRLEALTVEDVNRAAREYLRISNRTVGRFLPTDEPVRAEIPPVPDLDSVLADYRGREVTADVEAFDPTPENVEARKATFTLGNGFEVVLVPKSTRGNRVHGRLRLAHGDEASLRGRATAGDLVGPMLTRGTRDLDRQALADSLDRLDAQLSVSGGAIVAAGSLRATRDNLTPLLELLGDVLRRPAFSETEFQILKEQRLAAVEAQRSDPGALAQLALQRHMDPLPEDHPEYVPTLDEAADRLGALTLPDVRAFYEEFFGPQDGNLVLVGDFDPAEARGAVERVLGDWESPHPFTRVASDARDVPADEIVIETPDRANAFFLAQQNLLLSDGHPDYPALALATYMLGGGVLNSRLTRRIREEEGISYSVGASLSAHPVDRDGAFFAFAIHAPQNGEAVESAFFDVLEDVLEDGFREDEMATAKQGYLESRQLARSDDAGLAATLSARHYFDRTLVWDAELEARVRDLDLGEVNQAVRDHLDPERITVVRAGDFAGVVDGGGAP